MKLRDPLTQKYTFHVHATWIHVLSCYSRRTARISIPSNAMPECNIKKVCDVQAVLNYSSREIYDERIDPRTGFSMIISTHFYLSSPTSRNRPSDLRLTYPARLLQRFWFSLGITCKQRRKSASRSGHNPPCPSVCLSTPLSGLSWVSCRRKLYIGFCGISFIFHCLQRMVLHLKEKNSTTHTKS
jgi:hypothetical protein